jgi:nucleoside-diphosphate kinase
MPVERTLVVLKPDAVQRQLVGRIVGRFEQKGLKIVAMKFLSVSGDLARRMYSVHEGKSFYGPLVEFITASPVVAMVLEGAGAIAVCRSLMGPTFGPDAPGGTIRGDFGMSRRYNLIHGSDSPEAAGREIPLFFAPGEVVDYELIADRWIYARSGDGQVI